MSFLFNNFINDLLVYRSEANISNFADTRNLYKCERYVEIVSQKLEINANIVINCLRIIDMIAYSKNLQHMFLASNKNVEMEIAFAGKTNRSLSGNQLCVTVDTNLNFKSHNENICCKGINKIGTLF